jgi:hypothetical protein
MDEPKKKRNYFVIIITLFAVAFGIGIGLCALDYSLANHGIGKSSEEFGVGPLDSVSLAVMVLSAFGLVITIIIWVIVLIFCGLSRSSSSSPTLPDKNDDTDRIDSQ